MKKLSKIWGIAIVAFMLILSAPNKIYAQEGGYVSDQEFYDELSPYGTWVYDDQYGNVWIPDVDQDFRPYATNGYWAMTEYGNTWVSNYPWGWATFHYGRWHFDDYYGWEWVPGNQWAPAWVSWRNGGGYYGWAPLEPEISTEAYFDGGDYDIPDNYWVFAPQQYITYPNIYNYYVPAYRVRTIIPRTTYIRNRYERNNIRYITGPRREEVQRYTNRPVRVYNINNVSRPSRITVNNNNINIYRPSIRRDADARPSRVVDASAYKRENPSQRIGGFDRRHGTAYNPANASKLAETARNAAPNTNVVRVNDNRYRDNTGFGNRGNRPNRATNPADAAQTQQRSIDRQQADQQHQQIRDQQRQQMQQQRDQEVQQQQNATRERGRIMDDQQRQQLQQQREQAQQQRQQQQEQIRQAREQQRQNRDQQTADQRAQQQQLIQQQARDQQRQQQEQIRQQRQQILEQQRQQQDQVRQQQAEQQRQQQDQARQQQAQQIREQQRQQQEQVRQQQMQQAQQMRDQQRQQQEQMRQQQEQARQQQQQMQDQQRQAQEQQRAQQLQQMREQQRQQQDQQRAQQQQREQPRNARPARQ